MGDDSTLWKTEIWKHEFARKKYFFLADCNLMIIKDIFLSSCLLSSPDMFFPLVFPCTYMYMS